MDACDDHTRYSYIASCCKMCVTSYMYHHCCHDNRTMMLLPVLPANTKASLTSEIENEAKIIQNLNQKDLCT